MYHVTCILQSARYFLLTDRKVDTIQLDMTVDLVRDGVPGFTKFSPTFPDNSIRKQAMAIAQVHEPPTGQPYLFTQLLTEESHIVLS